MEILQTSNELQCKQIRQVIRNFYNSYVTKNEINIASTQCIDIYQCNNVEAVSYQHEDDDLLFWYVDLFINIRGENYDYK